MAAGSGPEFSRPLSLERLGDTVHEARLTASPAERAALALRFGLLALTRLEATVRARRTGPGKLVRLDGHLEAEVTQPCVVSLEPVESHIAEAFTQFYSLDPVDPSARVVAVTPGAEEDDPEPLGPGGLDLGEAAAQQLALALEPYPRAPGAGPLAVPEAPGGAAAEERHPFGALRALKPR